MFLFIPQGIRYSIYQYMFGSGEIIVDLQTILKEKMTIGQRCQLLSTPSIGTDTKSLQDYLLRSSSCTVRQDDGEFPKHANSVDPCLWESWQGHRVAKRLHKVLDTMDQDKLPESKRLSERNKSLGNQ